MLIKDMDYTHDHTPQQLSAVKSWLKSRRQKLELKTSMGSHKNAAGCLVYNDDSLATKASWQCHGFLSDPGFGPKGDKFGVLLGTVIMPPIRCNVSDYTTEYSCNEDGYDHKASLHFLDWLCHRSPYTPFVVEYIPECGIIINTKAPSNILAAICIFSRNHREKHAKVRLWHYMTTELGIDETLAIYPAFNCGLVKPVANYGHIKDQIEPSAYGTGGGHLVFNGTESTQAVKNFIVGDCHRHRDPYRKSNQYYSYGDTDGVANVFEPKGASLPTRFFGDIVKIITTLNEGKALSKPELKMPFGNYTAKPVEQGRVLSSDFMKYLPQITDSWR